MALQADAWYETQWLSNTMMSYQNEGFLTKGLGLPPVSVNANEVKWRLAGSGSASDLVRGAQEVQPMNSGRTIVTGTMSAKQAAEYIDAVDVNRMGANERDIVNKTCSSALGKAADKLFIDQLVAAADTGVGAYNAAMTLDVAIQGIQRLQSRVPNVWRGGRRVYGLLTSNPWNQLNTYPEFSNSQWVGNDLPFARMTAARFWNGVYWMLWPDVTAAEGGLPLSTQERSCFLFVDDAIGAADAETLTGSVTWENTRTAWLHNMWFDMCRKLLQAEGVVLLKCQDNATISTISERTIAALGA